MYYPYKATLVSKADSGKYNTVSNTRLYLLNIYESSLPEPHASLAMGFVSGVQEDVSESFSNILWVTGTTHLIAASGSNLELVSSMSGYLFMINRKYRLFLGSVMAFVFCLVAGFGASLQRAFISMVIRNVALLLGYKVDSQLLVIICAALHVLINPEIIFDLGFQLSYCSVIGIVFLSPVLLQLRAFKNLVFCEQIAITLSAFLLTTPICIVNFGVLSVVGLIANLLVFSLCDGIVFCCAAVLLVNIMFCPLSFIPCFFAWIYTDLFIKILEFVSTLPVTVIQITWFKTPHAIFCYFLIFCFILNFHKDYSLNEN
ncbi:ComEC/Rec2 family competence protein [Candidatus Dojkabacteria bacterium]|nr:ComEC/Rec2 family competence protein [Candidatus Dojkabacteria bacterium]